MDDAERARLKAKGWVETTVEEFLGLDEVDLKIVELRVRIAKAVRTRRLAAKLSQKALAERMNVSQPRIPGIEAGTSTSLDAMVAAFFAAGGSLEELATVVAAG